MFKQVGGEKKRGSAGTHMGQIQYLDRRRKLQREFHESRTPCARKVVPIGFSKIIIQLSPTAVVVSKCAGCFWCSRRPGVSLKR